MKTIFSICAFLIIFAAFVVPAISSAAEPTYQWSKRLGGADGVCVNNCFVPRIVGNNVYLGGYVIGNIDFNGDSDFNDDGELGDTASSSEDIFFVTYDLEGNYIWSMRIGDGTHANESSFGIAASDDGAVYIVGATDGSTDLNRDGDTLDEGETPTIGVHGLNDIIIAAYTDTGSSTWAKRLGGLGQDFGFSVDATNDIVVVGGTTMGSSADLSGDGDTLDEGESGGLGHEDGFISVFSNEGVYQWSKRFGGASPDETVEDVAIAEDKIFVIGRVTGDADLNGDGDLTDSYESGAGFGDSDIFLSVFSTTGTHLWSVRLGGMDTDLGSSVVANSEYVYLVGRVYGEADLSGDGDYLDPGESGTGYANGDVFITAFTVDGTYVWSTRLGGQGSDEAYTAAVDTDGVLYVAGAITGPADLDGDGATTTAAEIGAGFGNNDIFLVSYTATGTPLFAMRLGGMNNEYAEGLAVKDGFLVLTSFLSGNGDLSNDGDFDDEGETGIVVEGFANMVVTTFLFDYEAPVLSSLVASAPGANPIVTGSGTDDRSTIAAIQYQLNSTTGNWQNCTAADGSFDEASESFQCAPTYPAEGTYTVYVRAVDTPGNFTATSSLSSIQVEVTYPRSGGGGGGCRSCDDDDKEEEADEEDDSNGGENGSSDPETIDDDNTKVTLCHNDEVTITVAAAAVSAHLDHGDSFGSCREEIVKNQDKKTIEPEDVIVEQFTEILNVLIKNGTITPDLAVNLYTTIINLTSILKEKRAEDALNRPAGFNNTFTINLNPGDENDDVQKLQKFLNSRGYLIATTGPGSAGNETQYYGERTQAAVAKFQETYASEILAPAGLLKATGICGERTRAKINQMID